MKSKSSKLPRKSRKKRDRAASALNAENIGLLDAEIEPGVPDPADVAETVRVGSSTLAAGDLDASFDELDDGEELVEGRENDVDGIGDALGIVEPEGTPLATTERLEARDRDRWELDPESAEDLEEREPAAPRRRIRR